MGMLDDEEMRGLCLADESKSDVVNHSIHRVDHVERIGCFSDRPTELKHRRNVRPRQLPILVVGGILIVPIGRKVQ